MCLCKTQELRMVSCFHMSLIALLLIGEVTSLCC